MIVKLRGDNMKVVTSVMKFLTMGLVFFMGQEVALGQNSSINWSVLDMGFAVSSSSNTSIASAVGQVFVGTSTEANNLVESGFLANRLLRGPVVSVAADEELPLTFSLSQNYPNPFNPSTTIRFEISSRSKVELRVWNILGQHIATLVNEQKEPGRYTVEWDGRNDEGAHVSSGVYFYRLRATEYVEIKKLILLK